MSIATEIQRLKTAKADIKTAIEEKGIIVGDGTIDTYAEKIGQISDGGDYEQGYEDGKNSVIDCARYAKTIAFDSLNHFGKEDLTFNFDVTTTLSGLLCPRSKEKDNTTVSHLTINCLNPVTSVYRTVSANTRDDVLKRLTFNVDTSQGTIGSYSLCKLYALEVVDGMPWDFSSSTSIPTTAFDLLPKLREMRVVKESIKASISVSLPSASDETIQSFVDGLADLTGQTSQILTVHQTVRNKLTDDQLTTISDKNWAISPAEATT